MEEPIDSTPLNTSNDLVINSEAFRSLRETGSWGKFLGIVGFCVIGLICIGALFAGSLFAAAGVASPFAGFEALIAVFYIGFALLYFFPVFYLFQFSLKIKEALKTNDSNTLASALVSLKSLYKFLGIMTIIVFGFYALFGGIALIGLAFR